MTNRSVPLPAVLPLERLLVQQLSSGFFHVIARYGYAEHVQQGDTFVLVWPAACNSSCICLILNNRLSIYTLTVGLPT